MSDIPSNAFKEILQRVPVDSLFRLRSVCKLWRSIIDDPKFAKLHIHSGLGEGWIIHRNNNIGKVYLLPLKDLIYHKNWMSDCRCDKPSMESCDQCCIECVDGTSLKAPVGQGMPRLRKLPVPCCNGLVLISSSSKKSVWVIWNPFTGESFKLPHCDEFPDVVQAECYRRPYSGLGYDEASEDYKVVRIVEPHTFIFSVNSRAWCRIEDFPRHCKLSVDDGSYANGALHWVAYIAKQKQFLGCIVALNLTTQTYRTIPLPLEIGTLVGHRDLDLVALSGCLFLFSWHLLGRFFVWMLKCYNGCDDKMWTKMMGIEVENQFIWELTPIAYLKNENRFLLRYGSEIFSWYNVEKKILRKVFMAVDTDDYGGDRFKYVKDIFSSQVIPASLVRIQK